MKKDKAKNINEQDVINVSNADNVNIYSVKQKNIYNTNIIITKIFATLMVIGCMVGLIFIAMMLSKLTGKTQIVFNEFSNVDIDPYVNKGKYNNMNPVALEIVTTVPEGGEVYGYCSKEDVIIPEGFRTGELSKIGLISVYLGKKEDTLMAAYKINKDFYYYVTDELSEDEFVKFVNKQWEK